MTRMLFRLGGSVASVVVLILIVLQHHGVSSSSRHQEPRPRVGFSPFQTIRSTKRQQESFASMRGGSSSLPTASSASSRAAFSVGAKPQPQNNKQSSGMASGTAFARAEADDEDQQRALAKDVLDAFLTRDSRNSFIGTPGHSSLFERVPSRLWVPQKTRRQPNHGIA